jgi:hypothetical protein
MLTAHRLNHIGAHTEATAGFLPPPFCLLVRDRRLGDEFQQREHAYYMAAIHKAHSPTQRPGWTRGEHRSSSVNRQHPF